VSDEEFEENSDGFKALRKAYEKLRSEKDDLSKELNVFREQASRQSLEDLFKAKGVNPLVAEFYHAEDKSEAAVTAWLDKYKDVLPGLGAGQPGGEQQPDQQEPPASTAPQEVQEAFGRLQQVGQGGAPSIPASLTAQIEAAGSYEEVLKAIGR